MKKVKYSIYKHPIWFGAITFGLLSLLCNTLWILAFNMAHIYDIIHVIPVIFIYEPIISILGGLVPTEFIFVPLAVMIDSMMGCVFALILKRLVKDKFIYMWSIIGAFAVYFIVITYQWLPIL